MSEFDSILAPAASDLFSPQEVAAVDVLDSVYCQPLANYRYCLKREMSTQTDKPKRGRKPKNVKPFKKTEEKDKFWLRAFRTYIKKEYRRFKSDLLLTERAFWREYLSKIGQPERSTR